MIWTEASVNQLLDAFENFAASNVDPKAVVEFEFVNSQGAVVRELFALFI